VRGAVQFPSVWKAFANSLLIAGTQTVVVVTVASLAGYYLSRFQFPARASMLRALLGRTSGHAIRQTGARARAGKRHESHGAVRCSLPV
jgi:hypothetical protein